MLLVLPIRTESASHRPPLVNHLLLVVNAGMFLWFREGRFGDGSQPYPYLHLYLQSDAPALHQFFTYQFLHADAMHLLGNMLFLWVFGNSVNSKLGDLPYLFFYLAMGIFSGWGYALVQPEGVYLVGASGAIAGVTTAYLVLFPRSRVTVLVWFVVFIQFIEVPALLLIGLKIIVWDNLAAPLLGQTQNVAHGAHLAGYFFGFLGSLLLLLFRALPRDQFDILALGRRWHQRRGMRVAMRNPEAAARAQFGNVAKPVPSDPVQRAREDEHLDEIADLRGRIEEALSRQDLSAAAELYEALLEKDGRPCLSERRQLDLARAFYGGGWLALAARAFEQFVRGYPSSTEAPNVRLLLGIVYARDLDRPEEADRHLTAALSALRDPRRVEQCREWLTRVRASLGRPAPDASTDLDADETKEIPDD